MDIGAMTIATYTVLGAVSLIWVISVKMRDASIADIWWGPGFAVIAWSACSVAETPSTRLYLATGLLTIWGLRLGSFLARRNLGHGEDKRYAAMRGDSPHFWWVALFQVFYLQGLLQIVVALPVFGLVQSAQGLNPIDALGALITGFGIAYEATADAQLARFKARPDASGRVMREGLWAWSRHPNYFGNALIWLGIGLIGLAGGAPVWTMAGPAVMWFLLIRVSGVAMLERTIVDRRPEYTRYIDEVPAFVPRPPSRNHGHPQE